VKTHDRTIVHSSSCPNWRTEVALADALNREFKFAADLAATRANRITDQYLGPDHDDPGLRDALTVDWCPPGSSGARFFNPPFSREDGISVDPWVEKAHVTTLDLNHRCAIVGLIPSRTDTKWWTRYVRHAVEIRHIPHRVKFWLTKEEMDEVNAARAIKGQEPLTGNGQSAGFPSAVVIWRPQPGVVGPAAPRVITWTYRR
jgi:phage N-6-adenine-methyltransferase